MSELDSPRPRIVPRAFRRFSALSVFGIAVALVAILPQHSSAEAEKTTRYPYDPACPWGRLSNGQGMIHRCLTEDEAKALAAGKAVGQSSAPATSGPATAAPAAPAAGGASTPAAPAAPTTPEAKPAEPPARPKDFTLRIGPIKAEAGDITMGKLAQPMDRYRACILDNGGLSEAKGKVVLSFLVQAERSRAEGVEVVKANGVSQKAALCLAEVVDRRRVGTPTEETTGVQLTIEILGQ